jgi:hypothetical protein
LLPSSVSPLERAPQSIIGYHGCHADVAERLLRGEPFHLSQNDYDWLGSGAYFWEYAPFRAREWSEQRFGAQACILRAEITLGGCLNLMDTANFDGLRQAFADITAIFTETGIPVPKNRRGRNRLDRLVIDEFVQAYEETGGSFDTVRGCFPEGAPLFEGSQLLSHTHVQIAVRNPGCIGDLEVVHFA